MAKILLSLTNVQFVEIDGGFISKNPLTYEDLGGVEAKLVKNINFETAAHFCNLLSLKDDLVPVYQFAIDEQPITPVLRERSYTREDVLELCNFVVKDKEGLSPAAFFGPGSTFSDFSKFKEIVEDHFFYNKPVLVTPTAFLWSDPTISIPTGESFWRSTRYWEKFRYFDVDMENELKGGYKEYLPLLPSKNYEITADPLANGYRLTTIQEEKSLPSSKVNYLRRGKDEGEASKVKTICHADQDLSGRFVTSDSFPTCHFSNIFGFRIFRKA